MNGRQARALGNGWVNAILVLLALGLTVYVGACGGGS